MTKSIFVLVVFPFLIFTAVVFSQNNDTALKARLDGASLVVVGEVIKIEEAKDLKYKYVVQWDPNWHYATIKVRKALKGGHTKEIRVLFPKTLDYLWFDYVKFEKGQKGIFILRYKRQEVITDRGKVLFAALVASDRLDFQLLGELERVKRLLKK